MTSPHGSSEGPGNVESGGITLGLGQVALQPPEPGAVPTEQLDKLYRLSDPMLSELGVEELLDELLDRVRDALDVDTIAVLLIDEQADQLVARAAKGIEEEVEQGVRIPIGQGFAGRIAAERVAIFIADVDHADILNPILREKGIRSLLGVPLIVEGRLIGVMHIGSLVPRVFDQRDLAVLDAAAARIAPGIERAQLYSALEREHRVAMVLQRSLLPRRLTTSVEIRVAARYLPARDEVGGDWYDLIELPRGRVGIAIGDVVGHGVRAAALMGQLRTALHSYAIEGRPPGRVLELVDRFAQSMGEDTMATAAYAVIDTSTGAVSFATAGHLPPIVVSRSNSRVIEVTPSPPLGAFPYTSCREHHFALEDDEILVLYTDGLVERRGAPVTDGITELATLLDGTISPERVCRKALARLVDRQELRDDVAIIALQHVGVPADLHLQLPAEPRSLARMRRVMRKWLHDRGAGADQLTELLLAANEACANAIEHAYSPAPATFEVDARLADGIATITVRDHGGWREPRPGGRGRGLTIIEASTDHTEINSDASGTEVVLRRRLTGR